MARVLFQAAFDALKRVYRLFVFLLFAGLMLINIGMLAFPTIYSMVSGLVWGAVELVSGDYVRRPATRVVTGEEFERIDTERRNTREQLRSSIDDRERLSRENSRLLSRLDDVNADLSSSRASHAEAVRRADLLQRDKINLNSRITNLDQNLQETEQRANFLRQENDVLDSRLTDLDQKLQMGQVRQDNVASISQRMRKRSVQMVARNTGLVVTDSLPVIGVTAIIGGLAWDIKDTCEQLRDLKELERALGGARADESDPEWCGMSASAIFDTIYEADTPEKRCTEARLRTRSMDPPECSSVSSEYQLYPPSAYPEISSPQNIELPIE